MSLHFPLLNGDNKDDASNNILLVTSVLAFSQVLGDFKKTIKNIKSSYKFQSLPSDKLGII